MCGKQAPEGQHVWHRLSVHVTKKEPGCNQTAVIKPLTKSYPGQSESLTLSDISSKTPNNVVEEQEHEDKGHQSVTLLLQQMTSLLLLSTNSPNPSCPHTFGRVNSCPTYSIT
ncbi:hypothetical protein JRQ81_008410 [Phrynocephalus forsythii]|uniref:Uncharacterized protein n=1 Tax=Phrynocephalus forsythii TaxID=171643 RepID=A0A9Q1B797_9SAUR|nr:hypothetical protein JRQ81_008410 [Phrynocephalus forsythii]